MADTYSASIRQSELLGRLVIDLETTEALGKLSQFRVDLQTHQIAGFVCRTGLLGREQTPVMWVQVESVGQDSVLVRKSAQAITERFDQSLELGKQAIWTDAGNKVGHLVDYCIDLQTGAVTQYLFTAPGWQGLTEGIYTFLPRAVVSAGQKRLMVQHAALENADQFLPGVTDRLTGVLQQDFKQTRADLEGVTDSAQEVADKVQQQTQQLTEQARSQMGQVFGQLKQRGKQLRSQVNDRVADAAANLQDSQARHREERLPGTTIDVDSEAVWPEAADQDSVESTPNDSQRFS